jgi:hypothetical protein
MSLSLNIEGIILLLFFIAPGFVFMRTYTAYRPRYFREPSAFEQTVLAVVGSTIINTFILAIITVIILILWAMFGQPLYTSYIPDFSAPVSTYPLPDLAIATFVGVVYLTTSLVSARRFGTFLGRGTGEDRPRLWNFLLGEDPPEPFLLWHTVLQIEPLALNLIPPHVIIQMRSGDYFEGDLYRMRLVGDEENTVELALRNVRHNSAARDAAADPSAQQILSLSDRVLLLRSSDILWLARSDIPR